MLEALLKASPGALSAEQLLDQAWDENVDPFTNTVRVTIARLRRKLGEPDIIHTTPGSATGSPKHPDRHHQHSTSAPPSCLRRRGLLVINLYCHPDYVAVGGHDEFGIARAGGQGSALVKLCISRPGT